MSESSEKKSLGPHFIIVGILLVVILAVEEAIAIPTIDSALTVPVVTTSRVVHINITHNMVCLY